MVAAPGKLAAAMDGRQDRTLLTHLNRRDLKGWWAWRTLGKALWLLQSAQGGDTLGKEKRDMELGVEGLEYSGWGIFSAEQYNFQ